VLEELYRRLMECGIVALGSVDHFAQCLEHRRQISLELFDRLSEIGDLSSLIAKVKFEQLLQLRRVFDPTAHHWLLVLDQHRFTRVVEDDVVLRIALAQFLLDLLVEVVVGVLGFPIAEWNAQRVHKRAVGINAGLSQGLVLVLGQEN
jgi:hypothetical protein